MNDQGNRDPYDPPYDDESGSGLLGTTIRNAALMLGLCLVIVWVMTGTESTDSGPSVAARPGQGAVGAPGVVSEDAEPEPTQNLASSGYEVIVPPGPGGHFLVDVDVSGVSLRFLVDTGASSVTLTEADARRIGLPVRALDYSARFQTANGEIKAAPVTLRDMRIGGLGIEDVEATVTQAPLNISLLGMSYLRRLAGYEVRADGLVLRF